MIASHTLCVLATGAFTAVGVTAAGSAAAVRSGISRFEEHGELTDMAGDPAIVASPPVSRADMPIEERLLEFIVGAFADAAEAITDPARLGPLPIVLALPEPRPGIDQQFGRRLAELISLRLRGLGEIIVLPHGHAAGAEALHQAGGILRGGRHNWAAVIGADSWITGDTMNWLDRNRQLHALYNAWGFIPGEAAGCALVSTLGLAKQFAIRPLALVESIGLNVEQVPIKTDGVCLGWGLTNAVKSALSQLPEGVLVDALYCDQNGESYRADEFGFMLARTGTRFRDASQFEAPADCWGDVGAATVPLLLTLATHAADRGYAAGPLSMLMAGSEGGRRGAVLVRTPEKSR